ncbi:helix-turn-helix transcriptional regulator [Celeribacter sp. SCSIO 80788]|uniref:helix-turn-helix transcriptional regulator n=1 Tax=Celeribacter sp. SCSIO 80788 TaxID=3117013 RepID=UPI003DA64F47
MIHICPLKPLLAQAGIRADLGCTDYLELFSQDLYLSIGQRSTCQISVRATFTFAPATSQTEQNTMSVDRFPGEFRIGVLDQDKARVENGTEQELEPKFQLLILLGGRHVFTIGTQGFDLDAQNKPDALMMNIKQATTLRHIESYGHPYRKLAIATPLGWVDEMGGVPSGMKSGGNTFRQWHPGRETIRLATQIVAPPPQASGAQTGLYRMSRGLELLRRLLVQDANLEAAASSTAERTRLYLLDRLSQPLDMDHLEHRIGLNRRSLQRQFKTAYGLTIRDFLRQERLAHAYRALSEDGVSIAQAAHLAGYATPENFTTAFRREYNILPHTLRNNVI